MISDGVVMDDVLGVFERKESVGEIFAEFYALDRDNGQRSWFDNRH